ncbi:phage tail domain-containing protein [Peribacillus psychrosaccharolyticus]|uniref:phage distal tail protein n=1 Tax=Peribacillus psychrosaccharolyticus TaxID=1407 RepID=UPI003D29A22A
MRIKEIQCTNQNNDSLLISHSGIYRLQEDVDTTGVKASVSYVSNYWIQGATAVSTRLDQRELSLVFYIDVEDQQEDWIQERRDELFKVFNPIYNPIRLEMTTGNRAFFIDANVELSPYINPDPSSMNEMWHDVLVQLSAGNPFFQDTEMQKVEIATWEPLFKFPIAIPAEGMKLGQRTPSLIVNAMNNGQVATGMIIQFKANGTLTNPSLFNVNTRQSFKINKMMVPGEVITVNTNQGQKRVENQLNGITTNIFNFIEFGSKFMQLEVGDNLFRYAADSNPDSLEVAIYFTAKYIGV